jgi:hypothetical protein
VVDRYQKWSGDKNGRRLFSYLDRLLEYGRSLLHTAGVGLSIDLFGGGYTGPYPAAASLAEAGHA